MVNNVELGDSLLQEPGCCGASQRVGGELFHINAGSFHDGLGVLGYWLGSANWSVETLLLRHRQEDGLGLVDRRDDVLQLLVHAHVREQCCDGAKGWL